MSTASVMNLPPICPITLIFGPIGAGKSFVAKQLVERDGSLYLATDQWFKELYLPDMPIPPEMSWILPRLERCERLIWALAQQTAEVGNSVVLDVGMATESSRGKFQNLCEESGLRYAFIFVDAPLEIRSMRVRNRNEQSTTTGDLPVSEEVFTFTNAQFQHPEAAEISRLSAHVIIND